MIFDILVTILLVFLIIIRFKYLLFIFSKKNEEYQEIFENYFEEEMENFLNQIKEEEKKFSKTSNNKLTDFRKEIEEINKKSIVDTKDKNEEILTTTNDKTKVLLEEAYSQNQKNKKKNLGDIIENVNQDTSEIDKKMLENLVFHKSKKNTIINNLKNINNIF